MAAELILACHPGGESYVAMWKERYSHLDVEYHEGPSKGSVLLCLIGTGDCSWPSRRTIRELWALK